MAVSVGGLQTAIRQDLGLLNQERVEYLALRIAIVERLLVVGKVDSLHEGHSFAVGVMFLCRIWLH